MTHRISTLITSFAVAGLLVFFSAIHLATGAQALSANGHGPGYLSGDGWWLGTYALDDGSRGFCLQPGKKSPTGHEVDLVDGAALDWYTPEQAAKLAFISRAWAGSSDRGTAAAGQLATWMVAGLDGATAASYAARAGADAATVLEWAHSMVAEAGRLGSRSVGATSVVELGDDAAGRLRVELTVDRLTGADVLPPRKHWGTATLTGATFEDGSTTADIQNGVDIPIVPTGTEASVSVGAEARFTGLPYGDRLTVAIPRGDAQALLVAVPADAEARAEAGATGVSPLPFQPTVSTVTSAAVAQPGTMISDHLTVGIAHDDGLLPTWGVRLSPDGLVPVRATIRSRLLGPFADPIVEARDAPADAPVACEVELVVSGTGEYDTAECELPAAGHYVWVETINPEDTAPDEGGSRLRPWRSSFGVASEITLAVAPETPHVPEAPDTPEAPETPDEPDAPDAPEVPEAPEAPEAPEVPEVPGQPEEPHVPVAPETPIEPGIPAGTDARASTDVAETKVPELPEFETAAAYQPELAATGSNTAGLIPVICAGGAALSLGTGLSGFAMRRRDRGPLRTSR